MRLAIINLTGGGYSGGHKSYIANIVPRLAASERVEKVLCASPAGFKTETWLAPSPKIELSVCEPFSFLRPAPGPELKRTLDAFKPDLVFVTLERHINYPGVPVATIVHNMAPLAEVKTTEGLREALQKWARRYETGLAVRGARAVIAPSAFVRETLIDQFGLGGEKVSLIHFAHDFAPDIRPPEAAMAEKLKNGFVFTAGTFEVYRGFEDLLRAFAGLKGRFPGLKLAVAGGTRPATRIQREKMLRLADTLGLGADVMWLGHLPQAELAWFYKNCSAFALTSRVESFCFVALEALAHGANCVSTESPCLPEIIGGAALYYMAGDIDGLSNALVEILGRDPGARAEASRAAEARAREFSWDKAASETLAVLLKAAGK